MRSDRPSRSAVKVGQTLVFMAQDERYRDLLPPGLERSTRDLLAAAGALKPWHIRLFRARWFRRFSRRIESLAAPGHYLYLALRKRFVHDEVLAALEQGAAQVLVVGAGMDTLCLRLAGRFPQVAFVELDHPASQRAKRRAVEALGGAPSNLHFVAADLASGTALGDALASCDAWSPDGPGFVLTEGLLMYLPEAAVVELAAGIRRTTVPGSRWLLTYMALRPDGEIEMGRRSRLMGAGMRLTGEPIVWGVRRDGLGGFLGEHGFDLLGPPERRDLRVRYLEPAGLGDEPLGELEHVAVAERTGG